MNGNLWDPDSNYSEVLLTIGDWKLIRRSDNSGDVLYRSMMRHDCSEYDGEEVLKNGEGPQECSYCDSRIPDEIWGMWQLHNIDQRIKWSQ
jgi:hypothetical protein